MSNSLNDLKYQGNFTARMDFMDNPNIKKEVSKLAGKNKLKFSECMRRIVREGLTVLQSR